MANGSVIAIAALAAAIAAIIAWIIGRRFSNTAVAQAQREAARIVDAAEREGRSKLREAEVTAKEKLLQARGEFEKVASQQRHEFEKWERKLDQGQADLDRLRSEIKQRQRDVKGMEKGLAKREGKVEEKQQELDRLIERELEHLERISGLTEQQARQELTRLIEDDARLDAAHMVKRIEDEAREKANREAQRIIGTVIQRSAADHVSETTVSVVNLPSDDMKGRVIGREGRNIRALEMATGVDLIVDDTPEAVIISGFDPYRREIARVALEKLVKDGRIHPARVEEVVEKVKADFENKIKEVGNEALLELNIPNVHPELVKVLGRLRYRTSYGQNVLDHSKEVAFLAATMAAELKADTAIAKRAGLFHDIGKAVDREMEGSHVEIGMDLLKRYGESEAVIHGMACHHGDYDPKTVEAVLVTAADALSAARPGARREVLESYIKRLEKLEELAKGFKGVRKSFAIQAGREIRVIVDANRLSDEKSMWLSRDLANKIESELTYPGQIKVTVIRETRSVEYAK